jgi:phosphoribosylformimino-5-aminoimidazole carboxamide ribotide isomerase
MRVIPAIDIKDKRCVRLTQGDFTSEKVFSTQPSTVAKSFMEAGAELVHVVDLDGARMGRLANFDIIDQLSFIAPLQVGGGIRTIEDVKKVLGLEARVVVSTAAVEDAAFRAKIAKYKAKLSLAVDAKDGIIVTEGWKKKTDIDAFEFARDNQGICSAVVFTSVLCDGMLEGPDFEAVARMKKEISVPLIAAGGISSYDDVKALAKLGIYGCIIGKALYEGKIELAEAIKIAKKAGK